MITRILISFIALCLVNLSVAQAADDSKLFEAVQFQDVPKLKELLAKGANANEKSGGRPMLGWAAQGGNLEVVKALLDAKAEVNVADEGIGHSPLMRAIETQQTAIVEELLKAKANPNFKTPQGESCLIMAIKSRKPEIVSALIKAGADVNYVTPDGDSPALVAAQDGMPESIEIIKVLGKAKANLNISNIIYTPLFYAAEQENVELVKALLKAGADPNAKTEGGKTPLFAALDNKAILELLVAAKADVNQSDSSDMSALVSAIENGTEETVAVLIKAGADVNKKDAYGNTPLQVAVNYSKTSVAELLKKHGATE